jgi:hypothetical protein
MAACCRTDDGRAVSGFLALAYGLAVLASFALVGGGVFLWRKDRKRAILMLLVAMVTLFNVWTWSGLVG